MKTRWFIICVLCAVLIAVALPAMAYDPIITFTYNMAQPLGQLQDATPDFSWRGWSFGYRSHMRDHLSLGFSFSWQTFSELESGTFTKGTATATGTFIRYVNSLPIMLTGHVYTGDPDGFRVYGGIGIGTFYIKERFDFGLQTFYDNHWHFGLVPEAGVMLPLGGSSWDLLGNVTYNYAFSTKNYDSISYVGINVGFALLI